MKYFPLASQKHSLPSARYAECAARQGKFWPFHDLVLQRQAGWKKHNDARPAFDQIAKEIGLDLNELEVCLKDESVVKLILSEKAEGKALRINRTPTYFINGKRVISSRSMMRELNKLSGGKTN